MVSTIELMYNWYEEFEGRKIWNGRYIPRTIVFVNEEAINQFFDLDTCEYHIVELLRDLIEVISVRGLSSTNLFVPVGIVFSEYEQNTPVIRPYYLELNERYPVVYFIRK